MTHTLAEIARATGLAVEGDTSIEVSGLAEPSRAGAGELALAMSPAYAHGLSSGAARAAVLWADADWRKLGLSGALFAPRTRFALAGLTEAFQHAPDLSPGIHPTAAVHETADIGEDCWIGPFTVIGPRAQIGAGARIAAHVSIGSDVRLGGRALVHPGVRIGARCSIGDDAIIHPNAVIGADGFSFVTPDRGAVESAKATGTVTEDARNLSLRRIHSLAAVEIGDDVEIGACTTLDRGTIAPTRVGSGTKIDNQVQIGHNVQIGQTCMLCAQVGIAGSAVVGDRVVLGGKTGVADHVRIGSDTVCAGSSMVATNVPERSVMMGIPAAPRKDAVRQIMAIKRLPRLIDRVQALQKKLGL